MASAKYKFERDNGPSGFLRTERASTDALSALSKWKVGHEGRDYEESKDEEELLVATLSWSEVDESVGRDLDTACQKYGVSRTYISS